jgi:hypothetical protein
MPVDILSGINAEDSQLPTLPRAECLMQRAETLFPVSTSGLTAPALYAISEQHPFQDRLTGESLP